MAKKIPDPKEKKYYIQVSVTDLIKEKGLKEFLLENFDHFSRVSEKKQPFEKLETISVSLTGDVIENFVRIKLSITDKNLRRDILNDIETSINRYWSLQNKIAEIFYQELDVVNQCNKWIVYDDNKYDWVIDHLLVNLVGNYLNEISIERKSTTLGNLDVVEEKGYHLISSSSYYGNIIQKLEKFESAYQSLLVDGDYSVFSNIEVRESFILFTHVSMKPQWLQLSKNKRNLGQYAPDDVNKIFSLLSTIPDFSHKSNVLHHPQLHIHFDSDEFEGKLFATPDFIYDYKIVDIKVSGNISRIDYYQMLLYYVISKHQENLDYYGNNVKSCELVYVKRNLNIAYNFDQILNNHHIDLINEEIVKSAVRYYKGTDEYHILSKTYKKLGTRSVRPL